ncbi:hypothetical protein KUCAC02_024835 [Chaenocephalus aceratus]|nr:hypothetical protein KUCAC02_024835 [Chaenocephalus aceratus]
MEEHCSRPQYSSKEKVNPENKTSRVELLVEQRKQPAKRERLQDRSLCVTCGEACHLITKDPWHETQDLRSTREEADLRSMLLHARHASGDGYGSIIITAEDPDEDTVPWPQQDDGLPSVSEGWCTESYTIHRHW